MVKTKSKIEDIVDVVKKLRNPKDGCPWDISQNSKSLAKYTLEEAYEVVEAIEQNKTDELKDELGDLLLQVVYHSVISEEKKQFNINDVIASSVKKMKLRHPHIFLNLLSNFLLDFLITVSVSNFSFLDKLIQERNKSPNSSSILLLFLFLISTSNSFNSSLTFLIVASVVGQSKPSFAALL